MSQIFQYKVHYEGDINGNNRNTDDSQSENDDLVRNLDKKQKYKEDGEFKEYSSVVAKTNKFKMIKYKEEQL